MSTYLPQHRTATLCYINLCPRKGFGDTVSTYLSLTRTLDPNSCLCFSISAFGFQVLYTGVGKDGVSRSTISRCAFSNFSSENLIFPNVLSAFVSICQRSWQLPNSGDSFEHLAADVFSFDAFEERQKLLQAEVRTSTNCRSCFFCPVSQSYFTDISEGLAASWFCQRKGWRGGYCTSKLRNFIRES